ncbi:hypothetical protein QU487_06555 [Crenobacter sp. SG2305]|uniref:hypothetical protein n=1 Tax=Crenobacter oryzisoli TaxID=3056844 RepID=UPI0025AB07F9|nr:hypothetical protein [Crenobacter sp. SG2305]MDN0082414.1 hypothetical protein [Crenobacter sp. SG2305]
MSFDISKIKVVEVHDTPSRSQANELLQKGWVLLNTGTGIDGSSAPYTMFVLGRPEGVEQ